MAKSRSFCGGPHWPINTLWRSTPSLNANGNVGALNERMILTGLVESEDGASHDYDTIIWRTQTNSVPSLTVTVGFADLDTADAGPPARDDGTIDQTGTAVDPASSTTITTTLGAARTLVHGATICVVWKNTAWASGYWRLAYLTAESSGGVHRPVLTSFIGAAYARITNAVPMVTLYDSVAGKYATLKGCIPALSAAPTTVSINTGTAITRAGFGFTVAAPQWGLEGWIFVGTTNGGSFTVDLYENTTQVGTMSVLQDTWASDGGVLPLYFCFPDVAFTSGKTYYVVIVPTTATNVSLYTLACSAAGLWKPMASLSDGGTMGYATYQAGAWDALTQTSVPLAQVAMTAVDSGGGAGVGAGRTVPRGIAY